MFMSFGRFHRGVCAAGLLLAACLGGETPAAAIPLKAFPLGESAGGAICNAVPDLDDPATDFRGARAWSVHCRGLQGVFGHLYLFERDAAAAVGAAGPWQAAVKSRADCPPLQAATIAGLASAQTASCRFRSKPLGYVAYSGWDGDRAAASDGLEAINTLLLVGVKVVLGKLAIPDSELQNMGGNAADSDALVQAAAALSDSVDSLRTRGGLENKGWQFADAERDFRKYVTSTDLAAGDRVAAEFDIALNASNQGSGHFEKAEQLFAAAMADAAKLHNPRIDALALNYLAIHQLDQRLYATAITTARKAIAARQAIDPNADNAAETLPGDAQSGLEITAAVAAGLNSRLVTVGYRVLQLSQSETLAVHNAQAYFVIGAANSKLGNAEEAAAALRQADAILSSGRLGSAHSDAWLHAEIYSTLGEIALNAGRADEAQAQYQKAIDIFDSVPNLIATPAEADLYLGLGQAAAKASRVDAALSYYRKGFDIYRRAHGSLGIARDLSSPYFDLLLDLIGKDPTHAPAYKQDYFDATQVIVGQGTAGTLAETAAGASGGDPVAEQLARALKEKRREIAVREQVIFNQQDRGIYTPEQKTADDAEIKAQEAEADALEQQLLEKNQKYGQIVEETASLPKLQSVLQPGEIYVKTVLLASRGYAIAVTHDAVTTYAIPLNKTKATAEVAALRRPMDGPMRSFDLPRARALFVAVFGPVQDQVRNAHHLIYEPDGVMVSLPAALFITDDASIERVQQRQAQMGSQRFIPSLYAGTAWLGRNTAISLSVSAEAFLHSRVDLKSRNLPHALIAFSDPVTKGPDPRRYSLLVNPDYNPSRESCEPVRAQFAANGAAPLGAVTDAIKAVAALYGSGPGDVVTGQDFTDEEILARKDLADYRILVFGTHGLLPGATIPCLPMPALATSLGADKDSDGLLDGTEIVRLTLSADLVVLAACNSGGSSENTGLTGLGGTGDELNGLARDFFFAGAHSLLVSQWEVDRTATALLITKVFQADAGSEADALRQAQVALMDDPRYYHPAYWGGFTLAGDGAKPMPKPDVRTALAAAN